MSSTNRSDARSKHIADYYVTPQYAIKDFLSEFLIDENIDFPEKLDWLDPCAGGDSENEMSYPAVIQKDLGVQEMTTCDLRMDSLAKIQGDYRTIFFREDEKFDIVITNPPFNLAQEIIEKALEDTKDGGYVIMLLRLNYFGSKGRKPFWDKHLPIRTYVHHKRMSFVKGGGTDSIEYMHCVWQKGKNPEETKLKII